MSDSGQSQEPCWPALSWHNLAAPLPSRSSGLFYMFKYFLLILFFAIALQASRADDTDSCLQYTVNAVSGERQAPPKTEDGGDTEEVDSNLSMVYVRIHTGGSLPASVLKTAEFEALAAAELAGDGSSSHEHALHTEYHTLPATSDQGAEAAVVEDPDDGTVAPAPDAEPASTEQAAGTAKELAQAAANWEGVYQDVLQRIYSSK